MAACHTFVASPMACNLGDSHALEGTKAAATRQARRTAFNAFFLAWHPSARYDARANGFVHRSLSIYFFLADTGAGRTPGPDIAHRRAAGHSAWRGEYS